MRGGGWDLRRTVRCDTCDTCSGLSASRARTVYMGEGCHKCHRREGLLVSAIPVWSLLGWAFKSETSKATAARAGLPLRLESPFELSKKRCAGPDVLACGRSPI